jgi:hypothetical protein
MQDHGLIALGIFIVYLIFFVAILNRDRLIKLSRKCHHAIVHTYIPAISRTTSNIFGRTRLNHVATANERLYAARRRQRDLTRNSYEHPTAIELQNFSLVQVSYAQGIVRNVSQPRSIAVPATAYLPTNQRCCDAYERLPSSRDVVLPSYTSQPQHELPPSDYRELYPDVRH